MTGKVEWRDHHYRNGENYSDKEIRSRMEQAKLVFSGGIEISSLKIYM